MSRIYTPLQLYQWFINNYSYRKCIITHHKYKFVHSINFCFFFPSLQPEKPIRFSRVVQIWMKKKTIFVFTSTTNVRYMFNSMKLNDWFLFNHMANWLSYLQFKKLNFIIECFASLPLTSNVIQSEAISLNAWPIQPKNHSISRSLVSFFSDPLSTDNRKRAISSQTFFARNKCLIFDLQLFICGYLCDTLLPTLPKCIRAPCDS